VVTILAAMTVQSLVYIYIWRLSQIVLVHRCIQFLPAMW